MNANIIDDVAIIGGGPAAEPDWANFEVVNDALLPPVQPVGPLPMNPVAATQKIDIPTFSGEASDVMSAKNWLRRIKRTCLANNWDDYAALNMAINGLRGDAWNWYEANCELLNLRENFEVFRINFIKDYQNTGNHKGVAHIIQMCDIKKGDNVSVLFNRIMIHANDWMETIVMPNRLPKDQSNPPLIRALQGYDALSVEEAARAYETGFKQGMEYVKRHLVECLYFRGMPKEISDKLLALNLTNLVEIKRTAQKLERHMQDLVPAAIHVVNNKRQATGPRNDAKKLMKCLYCKKRGHLQAECRKRIKENGKMVPIPKTVNEVSENLQEEKVESFSLNF